MASTPAPVSAATEQQHYQNDNQDHFHGNSPLMAMALLPRILELNGVFRGLFPIDAERDASERIGLIKETSMPHINRDQVSAETGKQVPARPHDSGSAANETVDGLDATTESLRRAAEDTPAGDGQGKIEKTPVFDRAELAPKI
jgi:hypothetical protein